MTGQGLFFGVCGGKHGASAFWVVKHRPCVFQRVCRFGEVGTAAASRFIWFPSSVSSAKTFLNLTWIWLSVFYVCVVILLVCAVQSAWTCFLFQVLVQERNWIWSLFSNPDSFLERLPLLLFCFLGHFLDFSCVPLQVHTCLSVIVKPSFFYKYKALQKNLLASIFKSCYRFSIGFRSRLWLDHPCGQQPCWSFSCFPDIIQL